MLTPIHIFDYPFDDEKIEDRYFSNQWEDYKDTRLGTTWPTYKMSAFSKYDNNEKKDVWDYAEEIIEDLGLSNCDIHPRFFWLGPNTRLGPHTDDKTLCSINYIINDDYGPIVVEDKTYYYKSCLLNCQRTHGVPTYPKERRLFKLSIFDKTFEEVYEIIKDRVK